MDQGVAQLARSTIMTERIQSDGPADRVAKPAYESPKIEETVTAEELKREVHYAGDGTNPQG
jgi:hypothetical protein